MELEELESYDLLMHQQGNQSLYQEGYITGSGNTGTGTGTGSGTGKTPSSRFQNLNSRAYFRAQFPPSGGAYSKQNEPKETLADIEFKDLSKDQLPQNSKFDSFIFFLK